MINISPILETYLDNHTNQEPEILSRLRVETYQCTTQPHMISGEYQGRLLSLLSKILFPKTILELGTFTGYATLCLAEGLVEGGKIITMDKNDELEYLCRKYFDESDYADKIDFRVNDARIELNTIEPNSVDLAFIDADKESYPYYFEKVLELLRPGGVMLVDNVLWYGKVMMEEEDKKDPSTKILKEFNNFVAADERVESLILPIRDGITLIRKK
ncbi:O-methyltransferase [Faecalibacter bovis]|uniref:Class I SAM-dependent methyltransferase n=1 Tax=Faecalibacter bovis TaxID=2898187 RepID=A0ABX7XDP8_9FLAO|nr:class I SAM-dependent methyltransferase [Faecalibacter bovis]MBS7333049.1 class I SAM-dependent methyltransferase [Weeksellaceae bacterium]QTV06007.1 class I SAM-dependent methyltransferase [Faecalibacter bovis]